MLKRAYSLFEVKSVDDDKREIEGIASTPTPDRMGDIVEPKGAVFKLPLPLLWQHNASQPIGSVTVAKVTADGIAIKAKLAKIDEPGTLKDRLDEAWQSLKHGLVRGLSIGFSPLESSQIKDTFSFRFTSWEWLELSAVTIPANAEASIQTVKSIDTEQRAASGTAHRVIRLTQPAGASASKTNAPEGKHMNIAEQIKSFEASRQAKLAALNAIAEKTAAESRSKDEAEAEEFKNLSAEIKTIDAELKDARELEALNAASATPIRTVDTAKNGADARDVRGSISTGKSQLPPGIEFARYAMCLAAAKGNSVQAYEMAKAHYPDQPRIQNVLKAAVAGATTTDATWASPLAQVDTAFIGDFVEFLRPMTIIGKFGTNGIPSLRRVPFNISIPAQTSGGSAYWVGQGAPKPLTKFDFSRTTLGYTKVANIAVLTEELLRFSNPSAEMLVRDALAAAIVERIDLDFVDPGKAEVANVSPASITNGVVAIDSSGTDSGSVATDVAAVFAPFLAANNAPSNGVWLMSATTALALSLMKNALGQPEYPTISMTGGTFMGLPVIVSEYMGDFTSGGVVVLVNASDIWLADDGGVRIDVSREASLQMDDAPTNNSATGTGTSLVSMFQTNSIAIRAERFINWKKRRSSAVAYLHGVLWSAANESL
jgi:HK97 family phage major capsid protein/HK97 family phage prohead protease